MVNVSRFMSTSSLSSCALVAGLGNVFLLAEGDLEGKADTLAIMKKPGASLGLQLWTEIRSVWGQET